MKQDVEVVRVGGAPIPLQVGLVAVALALWALIPLWSRDIGLYLLSIYFGAMGLIVLIPVVLPRRAEVSADGVRWGPWFPMMLRWEDIAAIEFQSALLQRLVVVPKEPGRITVRAIGGPSVAADYGCTIAVLTRARRASVEQRVRELAGDAYGPVFSVIRTDATPTPAEVRRLVIPRTIIRSVNTGLVLWLSLVGGLFGAVGLAIVWFVVATGAVALLVAAVIALVGAGLWFRQVYLVSPGNSVEFTDHAIVVTSLRKTSVIGWDLVLRVGVSRQFLVAVPRNPEQWPRGTLPVGAPRPFLRNQMLLIRDSMDTSVGEISDRVMVAARGAGRDDIADRIFDPATPSRAGQR